MQKTILMCPPTYFAIDYAINPWMHVGDHVDIAAMHQQWQRVYDTYTDRMGWQVELINPAPRQPDMVFATDNCLIIDGKVLLSNFRYPERQGEGEHFRTWLLEHGYTDIREAQHHFEGGGDNLVCGDVILAGHGFRSDPEAADELRAYFGREVMPLTLVNPAFYHLDTAVAVLSSDTVAVYSPALDKASQQCLRAIVPNIIEATLEEAQGFGLNAVSDGHTVITSDASPTLLQKYRQAGFETIGLPMLEFRKAGGGIKCMTLELR